MQIVLVSLSLPSLSIPPFSAIYRGSRAISFPSRRRDPQDSLVPCLSYISDPVLKERSLLFPTREWPRDTFLRDFKIPGARNLSSPPPLFYPATLYHRTFFFLLLRFCSSLAAAYPTIFLLSPPFGFFSFVITIFYSLRVYTLSLLGGLIPLYSFYAD